MPHREPGQGRPYVADETIQNMRQRASLELNVTVTTVWKILEKRLRCQAYRLQLVQALSDGDKEEQREFCGGMFDKMENEDDYMNKSVFNDEAAFHLSGKVNRHIVRIWGTEKPHEIVEHVRDSPKLNVLCVISSPNQL